VATAAALACAGGLLRPGAADAQASTPAAQADDVRQHYQRGVRLYNQRDFESALREFDAAVAQSGSANARLMAARCLRELGRSADAANALERAAHDTTDPRTREAAESELARVAPRVGRVAVHVTAPAQGASVALDGHPALEPLDPARGIAVEPGPHTLDVTATDFEPTHQPITVAAGVRVDVVVALPRMQPTQIAPDGAAAPAPAEQASVTVRTQTVPPGEGLRPVRWVTRRAAPVVSPWVGGTVAVSGALALATGIALWRVTQGIFDNAYYLCTHNSSGMCPLSNNATADTGMALEVLTNLGILVGIGALAAGAVLLGVSAVPRHERVRVIGALAPLPGGAGATVVGVF
jgi:hypothetical protein